MTTVSKAWAHLLDKTLDSPDKKFRDVANPWVGIIIHHTDIGGKVPEDASKWRKLQDGIANWLTTKDANYLSAHFQIGRYGECYQIVDPDQYVAYHAGVSSFWHPISRKWETGWNAHAVGIELLGDGNLLPYSEEQYAKLAKLCSVLMKHYPTINPQCIVGHETIAPTRKIDPGKHFDWNKFYDALYKERLNTTGPVTVPNLG